MLTGVYFQELHLKFTFKNQSNRGQLPGTILRVPFQESRLQGLTFRNNPFLRVSPCRNLDYRGSLPGTLILGDHFQEPRLQGFASRNCVCRGSLPEPRLQGVTSRKRVCRGSLPGSDFVGGNFQEARLQGVISRNLAYRGSLPVTAFVGGHFQEPRLQGSLPGTTFVGVTSRNLASRNRACRGSLPETVVKGVHYIQLTKLHENLRCYED